MIESTENQVVVIAKFLAKNGKEVELLGALKKLMNPTHKEIGCVRYELNQNVENPRILTYVEKFRDQAAFEVHKNSDYIVDFFKTAAPLLVQEQDVTFHRELLP